MFPALWYQSMAFYAHVWMHRRKNIFFTLENMNFAAFRAFNETDFSEPSKCPFSLSTKYAPSVVSIYTPVRGFACKATCQWLHHAGAHH